MFAWKCLAQVLQYSEMTLLGNLLLMVYYRLIAFMYRLITFASVVKSLLVFPPPKRLGKLCLFGHQSDLRTSSRSAGLPIRQFAGIRCQFRVLSRLMRPLSLSRSLAVVDWKFMNFYFFQDENKIKLNLDTIIQK